MTRIPPYPADLDAIRRDARILALSLDQVVAIAGELGLELEAGRPFESLAAADCADVMRLKRELRIRAIYRLGRATRERR